MAKADKEGRAAKACALAGVFTRAAKAKRACAVNGVRVWPKPLRSQPAIGKLRAR
jgi:hypothetical protein